MSFVDTLRSRGLVQDVSDPELASRLAPGDSFYVGFDPTSPHLHIGNLIQVIMAIHVAREGKLRPIVLFGGATGAIGDPSGRTTERTLLERETIDRNVAAHQEIIRGIMERAGATVEFVNNYDWTQPLSVLDFLRDVGKYFTVNYMLGKEVVKSRLDGEGISFTEFSYMLIQSNDFLHLYQNHGCRLQIGGSDQWGNITAGLELIRKKIQGHAFALSVPLLLDDSGSKFGKSAQGAVWIDRAGLSPYRFHQFWLNQPDSQVGRLMRLFTFLSEEAILAAEESIRTAPEKREAQRLLADEVTSLVHGANATAEAKKSAEVLFGGSLDGLTDAALLDIFSEVPSSTLPRDVAQGLSLLDVLVQAKLAPSKGEARRLIQNGGAYLDNERIADGNQTLHQQPSWKRGLLVLRAGKKNYHLLQLKP